MAALADDGLLLLFGVSVKAALLALMAGLVLYLLRIRNANVHHRVWSVVLLVMLFLPTLHPVSYPIFVPSWPLGYLHYPASRLVQNGRPPKAANIKESLSLDSASSVVSAAAQAVGATNSVENSQASIVDSVSRRSHAEDIGMDPPRSAVVSTAGNTESRVSWATAILALYAIGVVSFLSRIGLGLWMARCLVSNSRPITLPVADRYTICASDAIRVPLTVGVFRPRIVLPMDWSTWTTSLLASVLQHEKAHVDRKDNLVTILAEINRCFYWFHPLAWFLRRRLAVLAETTCDDLAVAAIGDRRSYAQHLVEIAGRMSQVQRRITAHGISMARSCHIESRVDAILDASRPMARRLGWRGSVALATVFVPLVVVTAGLRAEVEQPSSRTTAAESTSEVNQVEPVNASKVATDLYGDPLLVGATARLGTVRYRHPGWYKRIAFLADDKTFVAGTNHNTLRAWNAASGKMVREVDHGGYWFQAFCLSSDRRQIATLSYLPNLAQREFRMRVTVWDTESWRERHRNEWTDSMTDAPQHIAFSPDGAVIALGARNGTIRLHDLASGQEILRNEVLRGEIHSLAFSPNGEQIAAAGQRTVVIWNFLGDEGPKTLPSLPDGGQIVRFSPDGLRLAVGSSGDSAAHLFDARTGQLIRQFKGKSERYYREGLCFSGDGKQLIVPAVGARAVELFDVESGELLRSFDAGVIEPRDATISSDGRLLACIGSEAAMLVWDTETGEQLSDRFVGHLDAPFDLAFTPDDAYIVTGCMDGSLRKWNASTGKQLLALYHDRWAAALAVSPKGERLVSCGFDDTVRLWELPTGNELFRLPGHGQTGGISTTEVAFSPDGERFFSFGNDMFLRVYAVANGRILAEHAIRPSGAAAEQTEDGLPVIDVSGFGMGNSFEPGQASFLPDGKSLLLSDGRGGAIHFFDLESGKETEVFRPDERLQEYAITPNGKFLITFEQRDQNTSILRVRELASKQIVKELELPVRYGHQVAISPDGKLIGFFGYTVDEKVVRKNAKRWLTILDLASLEVVTHTDDTGHPIRGLAFSHDGTKLASSHEDSTVTIWDMGQLQTKNAKSP